MEINELIQEIKKLSEEDRQLIFNSFCRNCSVEITRCDWNNRNYCCDCSPDPNSR